MAVRQHRGGQEEIQSGLITLSAFKAAEAGRMSNPIRRRSVQIAFLFARNNGVGESQKKI